MRKKLGAFPDDDEEIARPLARHRAAAKEYEAWHRDAMAALTRLRAAFAVAPAGDPWTRWARDYLAPKKYRPDAQLVRSLCWFALRAKTEPADETVNALFAAWARGDSVVELARARKLTVYRAQALLEQVRRCWIARDWELAGGRDYPGGAPARWSHVGRK